MSQYKTTNGRPVNFKFGSVNIRLGKKPVSIDSQYAKRILTQYPGWIQRVGEEEEISQKVMQAQNQDLEADTASQADTEDFTSLDAEVPAPAEQAATASEPAEKPAKSSKKKAAPAA